MNWLDRYAEAAARTDRFADADTNAHLRLLAAGLDGETGGILAEAKKAFRDRNSYPEYRRRLVEEIGDSLWYYVRLCAIAEFPLPSVSEAAVVSSDGDTLSPGLRLASAVGEAIAAITETNSSKLRFCLQAVWVSLGEVAAAANVPLDVAASDNIRKISSRWPETRVYCPLFDDDAPEEDQLPRQLAIEFRQVSHDGRNAVLLRCNGLNFGDRVTDNIEDPDGYRYHDIFHFAHAVHLGWSPVTRALLRAKRKSNKALDEQQDGARAIALEEAVSAIIFSRAKRLVFFDGLSQVDYDLLKTIQGVVEGFEIATVPLWQWEQAILDGYRIFRLLRSNHGGRVELDIKGRSLEYLAPVATLALPT